MTCVLAEQVDAVYSVGIEAHGQRIGGVGVVTVTQTAWSLTMLAPAGLALFSASGRFGEETTVTTGLDLWRPWLERMPFERDLLLGFWVEGEGCPGGSVHQRRDGTSVWRGAGGRAVMSSEANRRVIDDKRRGYTLTLVGT